MVVLPTLFACPNHPLSEIGGGGVEMVRGDGEEEWVDWRMVAVEMVQFE